jgi:hypothetical protein
VVAFGYSIGEISCPTRYFPEASSINLRRSIIYGIGVVLTAIRFRLHKWRLIRAPFLSTAGRRLADGGA